MGIEMMKNINLECESTKRQRIRAKVLGTSRSKADFKFYKETISVKEAESLRISAIWCWEDKRLGLPQVRVTFLRDEKEIVRYMEISDFFPKNRNAGGAIAEGNRTLDKAFCA